MITFAAIAAAGDVNINSIAPGIAAALVATVAGHQNERLRQVNYRAAVAVWFNPDGSVARFQLFDSSDNLEVDRELSSAMSAMPRLHQPPPNDLPQPVKLRITSRGAG
jgi:TonB family protein